MTDKTERTNALALASLQMNKASAISRRKGKTEEAKVEEETALILKEMFQEFIQEEVTKLPAVTLERSGDNGDKPTITIR